MPSYAATPIAGYGIGSALYKPGLSAEEVETRARSFVKAWRSSVERARMIIVFGSINVDFVTRVERIPQPGETVLGPSYAVIPGGKGANQALAARRAGSQVMLVGAVGQDPFADIALSLLHEDGVDLAHVARVAPPTGAAFISVDDHGENAIVVAFGRERRGARRADGWAGLLDAAIRCCCSARCRRPRPPRLRPACGRQGGAWC